MNEENAPQNFQQLDEATFALYWAMVNDQLIERDADIEKQFFEWKLKNEKLCIH